jgi:cytochrome c oxidase subunit 2
VALTSGCGNVEELYEDSFAFGFPDPVTDRAESIYSLWLGSTAAALAVGAFVTGLIVFAVVRYRKRSDEMPRQVRYNLPVEVLYTAVPFVIIAVLFYYTVVSQNEVNALTPADEGGADVNITVVGFQWNWQFQHTDDGVQVTGSPDQAALPELVLPVGQKVRIVEESPDVIHSFFVPQFLFKRDVIPGARQNTFELTINKEGQFIGRCAEFCGERHSLMNFTVRAVSPQEYDSYIAGLQDDPDAEILTPGAAEPGTEAAEAGSPS